MPSVATFNLEIGGYCRIGSASCGGGFKGLSLVKTAELCVYDPGFVQGVSFKIPCDAHRICLSVFDERP